MTVAGIPGTGGVGSQRDGSSDASVGIRRSVRRQERGNCSQIWVLNTSPCQLALDKTDSVCDSQKVCLSGSGSDEP
jgi:hypothetical protein